MDQSTQIKVITSQLDKSLENTSSMLKDNANKKHMIDLLKMLLILRVLCKAFVLQF